MTAKSKTTARATVEKRAIVDAMALAGNIIEKRDTLPILAHVKIETTPDGILLSASNLEQLAQITIPTKEVEGSFSIAVPATRFAAIVNSAEEGSQIQLAPAESVMTIKSGGASWKMNFIAAKDFPQMPPPEDGYKIEGESKIWSAALKRVKHCIAGEMGILSQAGILIHRSSENLVFAGLDGKVLAEQDTGVVLNAQFPGIVMPQKLSETIASRLDMIEGKFDALISKDRVKFEIGNVKITGKLIASEPFNYSPIFDQPRSSIITFERGKLERAIKRATTLSEGKCIKINMGFSKGKVSISGDMSQYGSGSEIMECDYAGENITCIYDSKLLLAQLAACGKETIEFHTLESTTTIMLKNVPHDGFLAFLAPIK